MNSPLPLQHSALEIERGLLGYILHERKMQNVYGFLNSRDFVDLKHQIIFKALHELVEDHVDRNLEEGVIVNYLRSHGLLEKSGGAHYLAELVASAALESNIPKYVEIILEKSRLRKIARALYEVQDEIESAPNITSEQILDQIEMKILAPVRSGEMTGFEDIKTLSTRAISVIEKKLIGEISSGIISGYDDLDQLVGGFQRGDLIILAARPSMGKTALALNIAASIAKTDNVAFFSAEMGANLILNRLYALEGMIDGVKLNNPKLLTPSDQNKLYIVEESVQKLKLFINDTAGIKLTDLTWRAKNLHKNFPLSLIVIDYLQLITITETSGNADNRQAQVSQISRALKKLARELNVPVIALSQLSRRVEQRESKIPIMSDLRESGAIEQDADIVAFLYREDYYKHDEEPSNDQSTQVVNFIVSKHRNGATGTVNLAFEPKYGLFSSLAKERR